jgi:RNA polymerase sigma-70 factor (ECF subfamily)
MEERRIDRRVIDACRNGDREAFRVLFEAYKDRVYSIALHYSGDEATAKDVTQQVFLKLMTRIGQFQHNAEFTTWLYRMVVNACVDEQRKARRFLPFGDLLDAGPATEIDTREERVLRGEIAGQVRTAVSGLKPKLRMAILLRYFEDLSYDEMAEVLGCSKGTVASRLNRGHQALARKLSSLRGAIALEE